MWRAFKLWRVERRFFKIHRDRVRLFMATGPLRLRSHIIAQMQILIGLGVVPSWENFSKYGESWSRMEKYFSSEDAKRYELEWRVLFEMTFGADWLKGSKKD